MGTEVQRRHEDAGVRFALGTSVLGSDERGGKQCLTLTSGDEVTADVVIEAVGSLPNVEWLAGNGFDLSDGLLCDNSLAVPGAPWLVGVGDVARFPHPALDGACRRFEHWSMAGDMARHAAATLLHELHGQPPGERERLFAPLPWFWSDQYNWRIEAFGDPRGALDGARVIESAGDGLAIAYYDTSQRLVAVAGIGLAVRNWRARILQAYAAGSSASQPTRACRPPVRRI
jgi:NADPH-dependent 2,4-dienoyl-CoA reductase/sulfur reductase-like enzyme